MARVVIVGGGVIGCAVAERLSRERHRVTLLERDHLGAHASSAAAGLLSPRSETRGEEFDLAGRSLALFPELIGRIEAASGIEVEFRPLQSLIPALTAAQERALQGLPGGRWLEAAAALAQEPALNPRIRGAALVASAHLTPSRFVEALARAAAAAGCEVREGSPVARIVIRGGEVSGVQLPDGPLPADWVVLAAGPWSAELAAGLGVAVDVRPNRGQLSTLRPRGLRLRHVVSWQGSYLVPKGDGSVVVGTTEEDAGFDARPTVEGVASLLEFARRAVPDLAGAVFERAWAALRPATPDGLPRIGPTPALPNLVLATGHNRSGILLAPVTAELVAAAVG